MRGLEIPVFERVIIECELRAHGACDKVGGSEGDSEEGTDESGKVGG